MRRQRKPVHEQSPIRGQEAFWRIICDLDKKQGLFTITEVADQTCDDRNTVRDYMTRLVKAGFLEKTNEMRGSAILYKKIRHSKDAPRVRKDGSMVTQGLAQDHMWRAMKMLPEFTALDLSVAATTEDITVDQTHTKSYITHLKRAGYLAVVQESNPHRPAVYRLLPAKNTGPKAPLVQRVKHIYDPNLKKVVWRSNDE